MSLISDKALIKAQAKRQKVAKELKAFNLADHLFKEQLDFVRDASPNKIAVCSRRSGKTVACAADLVYTCINNPDVVCLYVTLSRNNAKKIIWKEIKDLNRKYELKGVPNLSELSYTFPNGSVIYLSGAKDTSEIEKFRGLAIKLAYLDEAQSFRAHIKELIDEVLSPALMDYSGTLVLIGTPSPIPVGFFHDAFTSEKSNWSNHHWTFWNNPFIIKKSKVTHQQMLDRELKRRGVTADDPSIQREWFGKFTLDSDALLLHYDAQKNNFENLPVIIPEKYHYIMGIDLGFDDADAIAILAYSDVSPMTYLVEEKVVAQQGITELVKQIEEMRNKYDITKMVIDQGGLGKKIAEELRRRHSIPVQEADKARKMENIAFLNDSLRTGRFRAKSNSKFAQDSYLVEIDKDKSTPDKIKVSDRYHSDIIDAVLYAFKESPGFAYQAPVEGPRYGSKEWAEAQGSQMFEAALEHFEAQSEQIQNLEKLGFGD
jgi:phage terminase large subunit